MPPRPRRHIHYFITIFTVVRSLEISPRFHRAAHLIAAFCVISSHSVLWIQTNQSPILCHPDCIRKICKWQNTHSPPPPSARAAPAYFGPFSKHSNLVLFAYYLHFRCWPLKIREHRYRQRIDMWKKRKNQNWCIVCHEPWTYPGPPGRSGQIVYHFIIVIITVDHHLIYTYIDGRTLWMYGRHLCGSERSAIPIAP